MLYDYTQEISQTWWMSNTDVIVFGNDLVVVGRRQ